MGLLVPHELGRDQRTFASVQNALDTYVQPIAAHAFRRKTLNIKAENGRTDREDARPTRSRVARITTGYTCEYDLSAYLIPSGTAGTAPDMFDFWTGLLGTETIVSSTSVAYTPSNSQAMRFFSLTTGQRDVRYDALVGAVVGKGTIKASGVDPVEVTFSGPARRRIQAAPFTLQTGTTGSTWVSTGNEAVAPSVGALYYQSGVDNSGAGFAVTAVGTPSGGFASHTSASAHGMSAGGLLLPFLPTETTNGQPIAGISGSLTWGPSSLSRDVMRMTGVEIEIDNDVKAHTDEALTRFAADFTFGRRKVDGKLMFRCTQSNAIEVVRNINGAFATIAATIVLGTTAGSICTISMPRIEVGTPEISVPEKDEVTISLPFVALSSAETAADEISITFT